MADGISSPKYVNTELESIKQDVKASDAHKLVYSCKGYYINPLRAEHIKKSFLSLEFHREKDSEIKFSLDIYRSLISFDYMLSWERLTIDVCLALVLMLTRRTILSAVTGELQPDVFVNSVELRQFHKTLNLFSIRYTL